MACKVVVSQVESWGVCVSRWVSQAGGPRQGSHRDFLYPQALLKEAYAETHQNHKDVFFRHMSGENILNSHKLVLVVELSAASER